MPADWSALGEFWPLFCCWLVYSRCWIGCRVQPRLCWYACQMGQRRYSSSLGASSAIPTWSMGDASIFSAFIMPATLCSDATIMDFSHSSSFSNAVLKTSCSGVGAVAIFASPSSVSVACTTRLSEWLRCRATKPRLSSRSKILVTVAWLRLTLVDNLEIATAPNSWMACKSNNCGAVSPAVLLNWREYRSVARMICLIVMRTSISWLRRIAPKYCPKRANG